MAGAEEEVNGLADCWLWSLQKLEKVKKEILPYIQKEPSPADALILGPRDPFHTSDL